MQSLSCVAMTLSLVIGMGLGRADAQVLEPYGPNKQWLSYDGNPLVLSGNGLWEAIRDPSVDITTHNSHCVNYGGNSNRVTLFRLCHETIGPWLRTGPGTANDGGLKWDLNQWNPAFWSRAHAYLQDCRNRGIFIALQVWGEIYLEGGSDRWYKNPFNGDNNINGYFGLPGGDTDVGRDDRFYNVNNAVLMSYQNALVQKALSELAQYPIIWDIGNEVGLDTRISSAWIQHWANVFDAYETANPGVKVLSTVDTNVDDGHYDNVTNLDVVNVQGASSMYPFTLSGAPRTNANDSRVHCKNLQINLDSMHSYYDKPLINSRVTSDVGRIDRPVSDTAGNVLEARHLLWTCFMGATHLISFRTTPAAYYSDLGTEEAQQALRTFINSFNFWECYIRTTSIVSSNEALVLAKADAIYAFYVPNGLHFGNSFTANLSEASGLFRARWFNPRNGTWQPEFMIAGGMSHNFTTPTDEDWALLLDRGNAPQPPIIAEVTPSPDMILVGQPYTKQLTLAQGTPYPTWSVISGPAGLQVSGSGLVSGWTPIGAQAGQVTITIRATNSEGSDDATWQVLVRLKVDFDVDGDVDLEDFGYLQRCYGGSGNPPAAGCEDADLNGDGYIDQVDFNIFINCFGGTDKPPTC
ncbi:MAG: hypothetical protein GXY44_12685 [Phycisphaerales bacterium]|nr:hypothetical protein [Phycisphaerales bacterium]